MSTKDINSVKTKKFTFKTISSLIFIIVFSLIITCFPVMYLCGVSAGKNYENKVIKDAPKFNQLFLNYTGFADEFEKHYNDHFPYKSKMIELYSYTEYKVFNSSILPSYTSIGKDGWLFYESFNTREMVSGAYTLSPIQLENIYNGIMQKYERLSALGKKYVIYLAAEKQMIYPEFDRLSYSQYTAIDQLIEYLNQKNCPVPFIYSRDYLLEKKTAQNQLYFKYDTHWNALGAHYGYESVMKVVKDLFPNKNIPVCTEFGIDYYERSGDLATTLYLSNYLKEQTPSLIYEHTPSYVGYGAGVLVTSNVQSDIKVFLYGDS